MRITKQVFSVGAVAAAVATFSLTGGTPAQAASAAEAKVVGNQIEYIGGTGNNRIMLSEIDGYFVIDDEVKIVPGPGCYRAPGYDDTIVHCDATRIYLIHLDLGAGQDWVGRERVAPTLKVPLWLEGGPGQDTLFGELGDDTVDGGGTTDFLYGRAGDDRLIASGPNDPDNDEIGNLLDGGDGNDTLRGGLRYDELHGGRGDDTLFGGGDLDVLKGGPGSDNLFGGDRRDYLFGEEGDDKLDGGEGNNELDGGPNFDVCTNGPNFKSCERY